MPFIFVIVMKDELGGNQLVFIFVIIMRGESGIYRDERDTINSLRTPKTHTRFLSLSRGL